MALITIQKHRVWSARCVVALSKTRPNISCAPRSLASTSFPGSLQIILWTHNKISYAEGFLLVEFFKEFGCLVNKTYENASGCIWVITPSKLLLNCPIPFIPILCREK